MNQDVILLAEPLQPGARLGFSGAEVTSVVATRKTTRVAGMERTVYVAVHTPYSTLFVVMEGKQSIWGSN